MSVKFTDPMSSELSTFSSRFDAEQAAEALNEHGFLFTQIVREAIRHGANGKNRDYALHNSTTITYGLVEYQRPGGHSVTSSCSFLDFDWLSISSFVM
jgi:hypothetical protein